MHTHTYISYLLKTVLTFVNFVSRILSRTISKTKQIGALRNATNVCTTLKGNSDGKCASNCKSSVELERWDSGTHGRRTNTTINSSTRRERSESTAWRERWCFVFFSFPFVTSHFGRKASSDLVTNRARLEGLDLGEELCVDRNLCR